MEIKSIERFFLNSLLRMVLVGVFLIFIVDLLVYPEDRLSLYIDITILSACGLSYIIRNRYHTVAVLILTVVVLTAMVYQCFAVPFNTTTSLSIILVVGFTFSVMLNGKVMWIMHGVTFICLNLIFATQYLNPDLRFSPKINDVVTVFITYSILYFILTYATAVLKASYDRIHAYLKDTNKELNQKAGEISAQNEELLQIQENLNVLNTNLERIVNERTARIQLQNELLIKYSYTNAHHLRGPVARLLGLAAISKQENSPDIDFIITNMVEQAHEIDSVIKQINIDLESRNVEIKTTGEGGSGGEK